MAAAEGYVRRFLQKGIPSLFTDLKSLYADAAKAAALGQLFERLLAALSAEKAFPALVGTLDTRRLLELAHKLSNGAGWVCVGGEGGSVMAALCHHTSSDPGLAVPTTARIAPPVGEHVASESNGAVVAGGPPGRRLASRRQRRPRRRQSCGQRSIWHSTTIASATQVTRRRTVDSSSCCALGVEVGASQYLSVPDSGMQRSRSRSTDPGVHTDAPWGRSLLEICRNCIFRAAAANLRA